MEFKLKIDFYHYVQLIHVDEMVPPISNQFIQQMMLYYLYKVIRTRCNSRKYFILSADGFCLSRQFNIIKGPLGVLLYYITFMILNTLT